MTGETPGPAKKPHRVWPGLVILAVLVLFAGLTGDPCPAVAQ